MNVDVLVVHVWHVQDGKLAEAWAGNSMLVTEASASPSLATRSRRAPPC
jgi:hypothetical protein